MKYVILIKDKAHSEEVQKAAFRKGWDWGSRKRKVSETDARALFFDDIDFCITWAPLSYAVQEIIENSSKLIASAKGLPNREKEFFNFSRFGCSE